MLPYKAPSLESEKPEGIYLDVDEEGQLLYDNPLADPRSKGLWG
jgi:hypothetical protein